ncbi:MAG TPA: PEP-CTERM sorting domain-containing protein [Phycisphaerae bacterium]|nr:PEP-CTERM sorting domain-containing protein [Phycisphaerae bacterium]
MRNPAKLVICTATVAVIGLSSLAKADFLSVPNFSFEAPTEAGGSGDLGSVTGGTSGITDWDLSGAFTASGGVFANDTPNQFTSLPDGRQFAFIDAWRSGNQTSLTLDPAANTLPTIDPAGAYTLTVAIGQRADYQPAGSVAIQLLADGNVVASNTLDANSITPGTFTDLSTTLTAPQAATLGGQQLSIRIVDTNTTSNNDKSEVALDNVRLFTTAVPEPASLGVLLIGAAALLTKPRRA